MPVRQLVHATRYVAGLLAGLVFCGWTTDGLAQQFADRKYGVYDGLSYVHVRQLHQDALGRLWIGTIFGLNVYDGTLPIANHRRYPMLPDMNVSGITSTDDGIVWANANNRLFQINGIGTASLIVREHHIDYGVGVFRHRMRFLVADHERRLWFTAESKLDHVGHRLYCWVGGKAQNVTGRFFANPEQSFRGVLADRINKRLLLLTDDRRLWSLQNNRLTELHTGPALDQLLLNPAGRVYGLSGTTLYRIDGQSLQKLYTVPVPADYLSICAVGLNEEIAFQRQVDNRNICWYDGKSLSHSHRSSSPIDHLLFDRNGELWVASSSDGLYHLRLSGWRYFDESEGWVKGTCSVGEDRTGAIWFGSWGNGLSRLTPHGITVDSTYFRGHLMRYFRPSTQHDAAGNIVFSAGDNDGVFRFDGRVLQQFPGTDTTDIITAFYDDVPRNRYLLAGSGALLIYNRRTMKLTDRIPLPTDEYNTIEQDKAGTFWIGGAYKTLLWDGRGRKFRILRQEEGTLPVQTVREIQRDNHGNLWLATNQGLWLYDHKQYRRIAADYIQKTITYCRFLNKYLIIGTLEGLFVMDRQRFYERGEEWVMYFDQENGFRGSQCFFKGYWRDTKGRLWIPTQNCVMMIPETQLIEQLKPVPAGICSFRDLRTGQRIDVQADMHLNPNQNDLEVTLLEPDNHNALTNSTYSYRLERLDGKPDPTLAEWSAPVKQNIITFRNLTDGRYRLTARVLRANGLWNTRPYVQAFQIAPPWWATWWFRTWVIVSVVVGLAFWRIRQVRTVTRRRLKAARTQRRLAQLEAEAAHKQKQLAEASRQRALLELKAISNQIDPHFVSNFLMAVQSVAFENDPETIVEYLAKFGAIFRNQLTSRSRVFWTLGEELEFVNNYLDLERVRFGERIRFAVQVAPDVPMQTSLPKMLIQGYVSNAIKHGLENKPEGGTVQLTVRLDQERLYICVEDDGVGLDQARQYRRRSTGRGLSINEAVLNQLNEYNTLRSWQQITDLAKTKAGGVGVRQEASLPLHPVLPPEEASDDAPATEPKPMSDTTSALA
ncbi:two-component system, LytT family, sensor kinase [Fibrisoma limi BUZ 3]|uniref:Two-component system, LytT family, sensor kinase n=1 Tax=Fibrisoma limi BUZ 3 TaxID=1185876 RepID=I2GBQ5_9BACT|nr:histidine kinase [Fibrisoma limi]CCH51329.1 two-component system, LytT family, sensor kinase [Fibrisoma limi BUZ 3]